MNEGGSKRGGERVQVMIKMCNTRGGGGKNKRNYYLKMVSAADFPNRKQNFTHTLCSLLSAIIKIAELPSRRLEKKSHNNSQPRLTPRGIPPEYCVYSRHPAAHRATTSSSGATFKFRLFLGPPTYMEVSGHFHAPAASLPLPNGEEIGSAQSGTGPIGVDI
jgi:hypothetical protein